MDFQASAAARADESRPHSDIIAVSIASPVLDTVAAARYCSLSSKTLESWRCSGKNGPPFVKIGRRVLYRVADLDAWLGTHVRRTTSERAA